MAHGIVAVAYYSFDFSKVLIGSLRKYYPNDTLVIVDNNLKDCDESEWLKNNKQIVYLKNEGKNKSHGVGLDVGMKYLKDTNYNIIITLDIDTLILKKGFVELCLDAYNEGYKWGGRWYQLRKGYIHPTFSYFDIQMLESLNESFTNRMETFEGERQGFDTGEKYGLLLQRLDIKYKDIVNYRDYIYHFGTGSAIRNGEFQKHRYFDLEENRNKYMRLRKEFFEREDVSCYL